MNAPAYSDTEKKLAKRLKKLALEEAGEKIWPHTQCLALVRQYAVKREGRSAEEFVAMIYAHERGES